MYLVWMNSHEGREVAVSASAGWMAKRGSCTAHVLPTASELAISPSSMWTIKAAAFFIDPGITSHGTQEIRVSRELTRRIIAGEDKGRRAELGRRLGKVTVEQWRVEQDGYAATRVHKGEQGYRLDSEVCKARK